MGEDDFRELELSNPLLPRGRLERTRADFCPTQVTWAPVMFQQARFWLTGSLRAGLLRTTEISGVFIKWFFPFQKHKEIFLPGLLRESGQGPGGKSHKIVGLPCGWVSLGFKFSELSTPSLQPLVSHSSAFPGLAFFPAVGLSMSLTYESLCPGKP